MCTKHKFHNFDPPTWDKGFLISVMAEERARLSSVDFDVPLGGWVESSNGDNLVKGFRREASTPRLGSALHRNKSRPRYLRGLTMKQKLRQGFTNKFFGSDNDLDRPEDEEAADKIRDSIEKEFINDEDDEMMSIEDESVHEMVRQVQTEREVAEASQKLREIRSIVRPYLVGGTANHMLLPYPLEVRIRNATYDIIETERDRTKISTVYNTSFVYTIVKYLQKIMLCQPIEKRTKSRKHVLHDINLVLQPGKQYLVLGPPGSGKTTLLKMISGHLQVNKKYKLTGGITYNGRSLLDQMKGLYIENAFSYVDQLDKHAALLTVGETLDFAFLCQAGGKYIRERHDLTPEQIKIVDQADRDKVALQIALCILGLQEVEHTFVGDVNTRGVSGGQKRRVTVGEMIMARVPVLCGDEITTGLDAASAYDMIETILRMGRLQHFSRVFSLLQPSPEVVSLFDEVIVLAEGNIIYAGPIEQVEDYFADLGFVSPEFLDVADFLQLVSTDDRDDLYVGQNDEDKAPSAEELAILFRDSDQGRGIQALLHSPQVFEMDSKGVVHLPGGTFHLAALTKKYANHWCRSMYLIARRFLLLWVRDRKVLTFSVVRNLINGLSVGGAFFNANDFISIQGALFQTGVFILLGSLQSIAGLIEDRTLFYKHAGANFYSAWPYVLGRAISQIPQVNIVFVGCLESLTNLTVMIVLFGRHFSLTRLCPVLSCTG